MVALISTKPQYSHFPNPSTKLLPYQYSQLTFKSFSEEEIKNQAGRDLLPAADAIRVTTFQVIQTPRWEATIGFWDFSDSSDRESWNEGMRMTSGIIYALAPRWWKAIAGVLDSLW